MGPVLILDAIVQAAAARLGVFPQRAAHRFRKMKLEFWLAVGSEFDPLRSLTDGTMNSLNACVFLHTANLAARKPRVTDPDQASGGDFLL